MARPLNADRNSSRSEVRGILPRGGTILGSSRTNPFKEDGDAERLVENLERDGVEGLIAIGGEDTLGAASRLHSEHGIPIVGVPKTIDNDLGATDYTFGFDTAVNIAMEAIDRLHTTADSHHRVLIVEVMGRHAGWIAFHAGLAGGANVILIPEEPFDLDRVCELVGRRLDARFAPIVVVSEGATPVGGIPEVQEEKLDAFGHVRLGGIAHWLEGEIESRTGKETRATVLGHVQRGGNPTGLRPRPRHPLRPARDRCRRRWALGDDDRPAGNRDRAGGADRGDGGAEDGAEVRSTKRPRSSLVEGGRGWGIPPLEPASVVLRGLITGSAYKFPRKSAHTPDDPAKARAASARARRAACGRALTRGLDGDRDRLWEREGAGRGCRERLRRGAALCRCQAGTGEDGGRSGKVRVRVVLLGDASSSGGLDLAVIGAGARRATEDSSTVGYIGETTAAATRFSSPIVESAGIAQLSEMSGQVAMKRLLGAIEAAGGAGNLREVVDEKISAG